jgi:hypothetical protein
MSDDSFNMQPVTSSQIASVGYNPDTRKLRVEFNHKGSLYEYDDIPQEIFDQLVSAPSVGSYFGAAVKNAGFVYRKLN